MARFDWYTTLPRKRSPRIDEEIKTDVFVMLSGLLTTWRYDRDRLAVACATWTLGGWFCGWLPDEVGMPITGAEGPAGRQLSLDEARELIDQALYRRNRRRLHAQANGLLFALEALATDARAMELHRRQEETHLIECRKLSLEERLDRLRADERLACSEERVAS